MFDLGTRVPKKQVRFRRPEFQEKLKRARGYERRAEPVVEGFWATVLQHLGLRSLFARISALLLFFLFLYFFTISPFFLVKNVKLVSDGPPPEQIRDVLMSLGQKRIYLIPKNHVLVLSKRSLLRALQDDLPQIRKITSFKKVLPNSIEIGLEERQPLYVWQSGSNYYLLDQDGVVYQKILNYDPTAFSEVLITDQTGEDVKVGQVLDIQHTLDFIAGLRDQWPKQIPQTSFVSFSVPGTVSPDLFAKTSIGFQVFFDLNRSVKTQLSNFSLILNREINPETYTGLSYLDLRLPSFAYYCYKDAPCALQNATSTPQL